MKARQIIFKAVRLIGRFFYKKHIWLVSDREEMAGDNGEAFFKFLQNKDVNSVFTISKNCDDYRRLSSIGQVIDIHSLKYKFFLCVADCHCSSHLLHMDNHSETPQIFLQHGVAYNDMSNMLRCVNHDNFNIVVSSCREREQMLRSNISEGRVWLTGLARFDYLKSNPRKKIVIALTRRVDLAGKDENQIKDSYYFNALSEIMSDKAFHELLSQKGYGLYIKLHPEMLGVRTLLKETDNCRFYTDSYNKLYEEVSLMITDYSSSVSDCAYLHKPIIYYHFDGGKFYDGNPYILRGLFDYTKDGFGPIVKRYDDLKTELIRILNNGCVMDDEYRLRVDRFFAHIDDRNCERIFDRITELLDHRN